MIAIKNATEIFFQINPSFQITSELTDKRAPTVEERAETITGTRKYSQYVFLHMHISSNNVYDN